MMRSHLLIAFGIVIALNSQPIVTTSAVAPTMICCDVKTIERQDNEPQQEARRLWEEAVAAKGGRKRLYAIYNMVFSLRGKYTTDGRQLEHPSNDN